VRHHTEKKSIRSYNWGTELDFCPNFSCCKPKLKWSSMKFDSRQTLTTTSNSSTLTAIPTNTNSPILGGNPSVPSSRSLLSTRPPFHSQLWYLMPSEERPSTRPILPRFRAFQTTSTSRTCQGRSPQHHAFKESQAQVLPKPPLS